jgi:hypothetical protein
MPALFDYEMALAAVDPWKLRADGSSNWSVHYFDRMGRWTASATGMPKDVAKKKAAKARRHARKERAKEISRLLTRREPFNSRETVNTDISKNDSLQG